MGDLIFTTQSIMHDDADIRYGDIVTIMPNTRYAAGIWFQPLAERTVEWSRRLELAHDRGNISLVEKIDADDIGNLYLGGGRHLYFDDEASSGIYFDTETGNLTTSNADGPALTIPSEDAPAEIEKLETDELNNVHILDPSESIKTQLQSDFDYAGATIQLLPNTTYSVTEDDISITSDNVSIIGPPSATIKLADGTVDTDASTPVILFEGSDGYLGGWTFDGNQQNQSAEDRYGLKWADGATGWTIIGHRNLNACGDAYGNVRDGLTMVNCYAVGFTQDAIDFWGQGDVNIANSYFRGVYPLKAAARSSAGYSEFGGLSFTNCALIGEGSQGVWLSSLGSDPFTISDVSFNNCHIHGDQWAAVMLQSDNADFTLDNISFSDCTLTHETNTQAVRVHGTGGTFRNIRFDNCTTRGPGEGFFVANGGPTVVNSRWSGGHLDCSGEAFVLRGTDGFTVTDNPTVDTDAADEAVLDGATETVYEAAGHSVNEVAGTRTLINGWGTNAGDPSVAGEWNGYGHDGLTVRDTNGLQNFAYVNNNWVQL